MLKILKTIFFISALFFWTPLKAEEHQTSHTQPLQTSSLLDKIEQALEKGEYQRAIEIAQKIEDKNLKNRAIYFQAYALFKLGKAQKAQDLLSAHKIKPETNELRLLRALIAIELKEWDKAYHDLEVLKHEHNQYASLAQRLAEKVKKEQEKAENLKRIENFFSLIEETKKAIEANDYQKAKQTHRAAKSFNSQHYLTFYYDAYFACHDGDYDRCRYFAKKALVLKPNDLWSKYFIALTSSSKAERKRLISELKQSKDSELKKAVHGLEVRSRQNIQELKLGISTSIGYDSNPIYINAAFFLPPPEATGTTTSSNPKEDDGTFHLEVRAQYLRKITTKQNVGIKIRLVDKEYFSIDDISQNEIHAELDYSYLPQPYYFYTNYRYSYYLFGTKPFISTYEGELIAGREFGKRYFLWTRGSVLFRDVHNMNYPYLEALEMSFSMRLTASWSFANISLGYFLTRGISDRNRVDVQNDPMPNDDKELVYLTDRSHWGHGPFAELNFVLPYSFQLKSALWLIFRNFDTSDTLSLEPEATLMWNEKRKDRYFYSTLALERYLFIGIKARLEATYTDNDSTLDESTPFDRNYRRFLILGTLTWDISL